MCPVHVSDDFLSAFLELDGPTNLDVVEQELSNARVVFGVDRVALARAVAKGTGGKPVTIARGVAPRAPVGATLELAITVLPCADKVNAKSLAAMSNVLQGQALGSLLPPQVGRAGTGVDGLGLESGPGAPGGEPIGSGVLLTPTEGSVQALSAAVDGCARLDLAGVLQIVEVLKLPGDVDLHVGDMDVGGGLHVCGTIRAGLNVQAKHDIQVDEAIEAASVRAGGSIRVAGGIVGTQGGLLQSNGEIRAKFTQNAVLRCEADVVLNSDTHSGIECGGRLIAREGGGQLRGGRYRAAKGLWSVELGSPQGAPTLAQVGDDPTLMRRIARVRSELKKALGGQQKLQRQRGVASAKRAGRSLTKEGAASVRRSMKSLRDSNKRAALLQTRKAELEAVLYGDDALCVRVDKRIHAGVEIRILGVSMLVTTTRAGGCFYLDPKTEEITTQLPQKQ